MADEKCIAVFQALGDPTRLKILQLLKGQKELCVSDIAKQFEMRQPSISHHLDVLRVAGLVTKEKRGREVYYRFNREAVVECCGRQLRLLDLEIHVCVTPTGKAVMIEQKPCEKGEHG